MADPTLCWVLLALLALVPAAAGGGSAQEDSEWAPPGGRASAGSRAWPVRSSSFHSSPKPRSSL